MKWQIYLILLTSCTLWGDIISDLEVVERVDRKMSERMPVYYNHLFYGGYFNMPSARMGQEGEVGFSFAKVPPYRIYSIRCQLTKWLEFSGNYRIFKGVKDPILSFYGFGDLSDKGANIKVSLLRPEDFDYAIPGLAVGMEDFMGTRSFKTQYVVLTQVLKKYDLELSLGYGSQRIRGFFGGFLWTPFRLWENDLLQGLGLAAEYDAINYKNSEFEKHPRGRRQKSRINFGIKYRLWETLDVNFDYIRGCKLAFSAGLSYNLGYTKGFIPKLDDPLLYNYPVNIEPIGLKRSETMLALDLVYPFYEQGFELLEVALSYDECKQKRIHLKVFNTIYRTENNVRERLNHLLLNLIPIDIGSVKVVIESEGFPVQQYIYQMEYVRKYGCKDICEYELETLTPVQEIVFDNPFEKYTLFEQPLYPFNFYLEPKTHTLFGSSKGKFKYSAGIHAGVDGYFLKGIYYSVLLGYNFFGDLHDVRDVDRLNPSQLINVHSDVINYYKASGVTLDEGYIQKNSSLGKGWYTKVSLGYFEEEYAGIDGELLWYPLKGNFSFGIEGAVLKKRKYRGLGFKRKIRKLDGFVPTYQKFTGTQYFANFYYRWNQVNLDFEVSVGKFLADDYGARFEISRYFPSGLEIYLWYTRTNGHDHINGETYYDKGIGFSMPLDIFYTYSSRERWGYGIAAWLRDVGYRVATGVNLYDTITWERDN